MDVTIMPAITLLIKQLKTDYPDLSFVISDSFMWSADKKTVFIDHSQPNATSYCLHELSHAILNHNNYRRDMDLMKLERDAWEYAYTTLAPHYTIKIPSDVVQDNLDTYRDWLHARSTCPSCQATGLQTSEKAYKCLACGQMWHVNEARICALRRYKR